MKVYTCQRGYINVWTGCWCAPTVKIMFTENARQHKWSISCDFLYHVIITCSCGLLQNVAFHSLLQFFYIVFLLWQLQTVNDKPQAASTAENKTPDSLASPSSRKTKALLTHTRTYCMYCIYMPAHTPVTVSPVGGTQTNIQSPWKPKSGCICLFSWGMVTKENVKLKPDWPHCPACSFLVCSLQTNQWVDCWPLPWVVTQAHKATMKPAGVL